MPFVRKPVAFDSINFLPGFPSLSRFGCNPWNGSRVAGACASGPISISREPVPLPASSYIQRAMVQAGVAPPVIDSMLRRGVVPASLAGSGSAGSGSLGGTSGGGYAGDGESDFGPKTRLGGVDHDDCGCGGKCGGCGSGGLAGLGFALSDITSDPIGWLSANAIPLAIGAGVAYFLFKRR